MANGNYWLRRPALRMLVVGLLFCCGTGGGWAQTGDISPDLPRTRPDRIILNVTADPATSAAVTWRTDRTVSRGAAQIVIADAHPASVGQARTLEAVTEALDFGALEANYHSVVFRDLSPSTTYAYRVGHGEYWSEWIHFTTAGRAGEPLSLLFFGDVQTNIFPLWSRVVRQAYRTAPQARLALYAGDLVNRANRDVEWGDWFAAGSFIHSEIPVMPTPGNHDHADTEQGEDLISVFWRRQFTLPENGPKGLEESCYYTDVQGVRFISINTERYDVSKADRRSQREWLENLLMNNPNRWTCILMHHPVYSTKRNRDNTMLRGDLKPLFDKYRVDLVLQGHDHTYARGMEKIPMKKGEVSGTMYVVSVSGPKMSEVLQADWMERTAGFTQLFHVIDINDRVLRFRAFTATGALYDEFELHKNPGGANRLIQQIPGEEPNRATLSRAQQILQIYHDQPKAVLVAAHRGGHRHVPENSLAAIDEAIAAGAHIVELDVRQTRDGVLVLMHDKDLDRTTTGTGAVKEHTFEQLKALKLTHQGAPTDHGIATLEQALWHAKDRILVDIDFKADGMEARFDAYREIDRIGVAGQVLFFCYDYNEMQALHAFNPRIKIMPRAYDLAQFKAIIDSGLTDIVHIDPSYYDAGAIAALIADKPIRIWANTLGEVDRAASGGDGAAYPAFFEQMQHVNVVQTDYPALLGGSLNQKGPPASDPSKQ